MRKACLLALTSALVLGPWNLPLARAAEKASAKPVAVVSSAGYKALKTDLKYVGQLSGNPALPDMLEGLLKLVTGGRGLPGIDEERPWGVAIYLDSKKLAEESASLRQAIYPVLIVPITDVETLAESLKPMLGEPEEVDAGIYRLEEQTHKIPVFGRPEGDWVFFAATAEQLKDVPEEPQKLLGDLPKQYDLAAELRVADLPKEAIQKIASQSREGSSAKDRQAMADRLAQLETLSIGLAIHKDGKTYLDVVAKARPDTKAAKDAAALAGAKSRFTGFLELDATLKSNWVGKVSKEQSEHMGQMLDQAEKRALAHLESHEGQQAKIAKGFMKAVVEVVRSLWSAGDIDGGAALVLKPDGITAIMGGRISDPSELENRLSEVAQSVRSELPELMEKALTEDAEEFQGVRFHVVEVPVPDSAPNRERLVQLLGEKVTMIVGIGNESAYVAFGKNAAAELKKVIEKSQQSKAVPPMQAALNMSSLAQFVGQRAPQDAVRQRAQKGADAMAQAKASDQITAVLQPIEHGVRFRIEIQEGVLKGAGAAVTGNSNP